ncbi:hypothetical protein [Thermosulfurimonas sp. F29]|uniref:hypothetical protein n=1 Tax=Thermosulfurimonas sp. F29 TaxID=2867247 RepID=UPI001C837EBA|nr:hypothetical protein [Thermosulfurimonas sp. F29]MBX6422064.1 hypothetical protein [Thermosulfurimonas sp. F29]
MRKAWWGVMILMVVGLFWLVSCTTKPAGPAEAKPSVATGVKAPAKAPAKEPEKPVKKAAVEKKKISPEKALFEAEIKPLSPVECARCHYSIYQLLKKHGGKHRQVCTNCHRVYHRYNPVQNNWREIMPKCQRCHGLPHGSQVKDCLSCHREPHSPRRIALADVSGKCNLCHASEVKILKTHKSAHQEVGCEGCHSERHGRVPKCFECHEGHVPGQTMKECLMCHNPHMPLNIKSFKGLKVENRVCGSCHGTEFERLSTTRAKHGKLACTFCHPRHGFLPKCEGCHGKPHSAALHRRFPQCLKCHLDPHSLGMGKGAKPVRRKAQVK